MNQAHRSPRADGEQTVNLLGAESRPVSRRDVVDIVATRAMELVEEGDLVMPQDYVAENAAKAAWLKIRSAVDRDDKPAFDVCTQQSIANAVMVMFVQGLDPAKDQCYFVVYGDTLVCLRSRFGTEALFLRIFPGAEILPQIVYEGETLKWDRAGGRLSIMEHSGEPRHVDVNRITGAYCVLKRPQMPDVTTYMTMEQIRVSWNQGELKGEGPAHKKFPDQMAERTVVNRACKRLIKSASDAHLTKKVAAFVSEIDFESAQAEIAEDTDVHANKTPISLPAADGREPLGPKDIEALKSAARELDVSWEDLEQDVFEGPIGESGASVTQVMDAIKAVAEEGGQ